MMSRGGSCSSGGRSLATAETTGSSGSWMCRAMWWILKSKLYTSTFRSLHATKQWRREHLHVGPLTKLVGSQAPLPGHSKQQQALHSEAEAQGAAASTQAQPEWLHARTQGLLAQPMSESTWGHEVSHLGGQPACPTHLKIEAAQPPATKQLLLVLPPGKKQPALTCKQSLHMGSSAESSCNPGCAP